MSNGTRRSLLLAAGGVTIAVLMAGAFIAGSLYPYGKVDAAGRSFQVVDQQPFRLPPNNQLSTAFPPTLPDPFQQIEEMRQEMDAMFNRILSRPPFPAPVSSPGFSAGPSLDLRDEGDFLVARLDMPGIETGSISVRVDGEQLTVAGSRVEEKSAEEGTSVRQERHMGTFSRSITLPEAVDPRSVETSYEDGVVTVRLRKAAGN